MTRMLRGARAPLACAAAAAVLTASGTASAAGADKPERPNIVMIFIDDMGYADLSCYGNRRVKTENIDRLAAEGIRFTQFYVNSPICSPSRAALLTGQYPDRHRITSYIAAREENERRGMAQFLSPQTPTLGSILSKRGYATGHFGKWHLGGGRDVGEAPLITEYGFDASLTQFEGLGDRVLPLMSGRGNEPARKLPLGVASEKLGRGQVRWVPRSDVTQAFADRALDFIRQAEKDDKPFYVNVWPDDVHSPFDPPKGMRGNRRKRSLYYGVLVNMDRQFGPLLDYIRSSEKLRRNTLVLLASDNGHEPGAGSAGKLRGAKGTLYEGGVRAPLIAWGPGLIPDKQRGTTNDTAVFSSIDVMVSLMRLAGADVPATAKPDGVDVSECLTGKALTATGRGKPLFWKRPPDRPGPAEAPFPDLAVRDGNWKLLVKEDGSQPRLYDLAADPGETKDLAAQKPEIVERLKNMVLAWNKDLPARTAAAKP